MHFLPSQSISFHFSFHFQTNQDGGHFVCCYQKWFVSRKQQNREKHIHLKFKPRRMKLEAIRNWRKSNPSRHKQCKIFPGLLDSPDVRFCRMPSSNTQQILRCFASAGVGCLDIAVKKIWQRSQNGRIGVPVSITISDESLMLHSKQTLIEKGEQNDASLEMNFSLRRYKSDKLLLCRCNGKKLLRDSKLLGPMDDYCTNDSRPMGPQRKFADITYRWQIFLHAAWHCRWFMIQSNEWVIHHTAKFLGRITASLTNRPATKSSHSQAIRQRTLHVKKILKLKYETGDFQIFHLRENCNRCNDTLDLNLWLLKGFSRRWHALIQVVWRKWLYIHGSTKL